MVAQSAGQACAERPARLCRRRKHPARAVLPLAAALPVQQRWHRAVAGVGMRGFLGVVVLVAGVAGLGFWGRSHQAPQIEYTIAEGARAAVAGSIHRIDLGVSGRDITVSGIADTEAERDSLIAALNAVDGRRVVNDALTVLPVASPYTLSIGKAEGSSDLSATGNIPTEAARAELAPALGGDAGALVLASGAPEGWTEMALVAIGALEPLNFGRAELTDGNLKIVGQAETPLEAESARAILSTLPEGSATAELSLLDDGTPPVWMLDYSAAGGAAVSGKLPRGLEIGMITGAIGLGSVADQASKALAGPDSTDTGPLGVLARWLPALETLRATIRPDGADVVAGVGKGTDLDLLGEAIAADLAAAGGTPVSLKIEEVAAEGADGAHRTNSATGQDEVLSSGFWLPSLRITPSPAACTEAANGILASETINFLSGSDRLDANARGVIGRLASVVLPCTGEGGLKAVIGGHTDATGDATLNLGLSQRRAIAVRLALVARGVPGQALKAIGHGASQPVATNDTEEGKAANRRTTIDWVE